MDMKTAGGGVYWQRQANAEKDRADALHAAVRPAPSGRPRPEAPDRT